MKHGEFQVGMEFWCGGRRWRCTDIGTRVVVAICLEPHEVVTAAPDGTRATTVTDNDSWFDGPPYAVVESVFDESDFGGCERA